MGKVIRHRSIKHDIISRDSTRIVTAVGVAVFLLVFCGFAVKTLFSQSLYNNRVISAKDATVTQLDANIEALKSLEQQYEAFVGASENVLGGNPDKNGPLDGANDTIILDSLPGNYDYPALASSFEKILIDDDYDVDRIGGSEDVLAPSEATADAVPIPIPFRFGFTAPLDRTQELFQTLEKSIRPMDVREVSVTVGAEGIMNTSVTLNTYYTQQKAYELGSKVVE